MYRSASWNREEDYIHAPPPMASTILRMASYQELGDQTPPRGTVSEAARKDRSRSRFAENAVHVIPLVLLLCAATLWFFSNPEVNVISTNGGESIAARIEGMTIEGDLDTDIDGTQSNNLLPFLDLGDATDPSKQPIKPAAAAAS